MSPSVCYLSVISCVLEATQACDCCPLFSGNSFMLGGRTTAVCTFRFVNNKCKEGCAKPCEFRRREACWKGRSVQVFRVPRTHVSRGQEISVVRLGARCGRATRRVHGNHKSFSVRVVRLTMSSWNFSAWGFGLQLLKRSWRLNITWFGVHFTLPRTALLRMSWQRPRPGRSKSVPVFPSAGMVFVKDILWAACKLSWPQPFWPKAILTRVMSCSSVTLQQLSLCAAG